MILLSDCVGQVESSGNPGAMRYEPDYNPPLSSIQTVQKYATGGYMDLTTARMIASTSFGEFQIMGANLYAVLKYQKTIADYLTSPQDQLETFRAFIEQLGFSDDPFSLMSEPAILRFARLYNGSEVYAQSLQEAYQTMQNTESVS
jgi:Protein of unknown function (DUF3380).